MTPTSWDGSGKGGAALVVRASASGVESDFTSTPRSRCPGQSRPPSGSGCSRMWHWSFSPSSHFACRVSVPESNTAPSVGGGLDPTSYDHLQMALARTARKARLHFGVRFTPAVIPDFWNWRPPHEVPPARWFQHLAEELGRDAR